MCGLENAWLGKCPVTEMSFGKLSGNLLFRAASICAVYGRNRKTSDYLKITI